MLITRKITKPLSTSLQNSFWWTTGYYLIILPGTIFEWTRRTWNCWALLTSVSSCPVLSDTNLSFILSWSKRVSRAWPAVHNYGKLWVYRRSFPSQSRGPMLLKGRGLLDASRIRNILPWVELHIEEASLRAMWQSPCMTGQVRSNYRVKIVRVLYDSARKRSICICDFLGPSVLYVCLTMVLQ